MKQKIVGYKVDYPNGHVLKSPSNSIHCPSRFYSSAFKTFLLKRGVL